MPEKSPWSPAPVRASAGRWPSTWPPGASWLSATSTSTAWPNTESSSRPSAPPVEADRLDVTEREAFLLYADEVKAHFGMVNQIYNNAGYRLHRRRRGHRVQGHRARHGRRLLGRRQRHQGVPAAPDRVRRRPRRQRLQPVRPPLGPGQGAYNAAKFAVRGFTEALRQEMLAGRAPGQGHLLHPGGIKTAIARNSPAAEGWITRADQGLRQAAGLHHARNGRPRSSWTASARTRPGCWSARTPRCSTCFVRITGSGYQRLFAPVIGRIKPPSRMKFSGRAGARSATRRPRPADRPRRSPGGACRPRRGVEYAGDLVDRQHLRSVSSLRRYSGTTFSACISAGCRRRAPRRRSGTPGRRWWSTRP